MRKTVILIHGLCRTSRSFLIMKRFLENHGFSVVLFSYNSTKYNIEALADKFTEFLYSTAKRHKTPLNIVSHSMGGILTRIAIGKITLGEKDILRDNRHKEISNPIFGRIVMLAPPNKGSKTADMILKILPISKFIPPLKELRNHSDSPIHKVHIPENQEIGVIAGIYDKKVSVAESHLPTEKEHITVNSAHTFIMNSLKVRKAVLSFLETGTFDLNFSKNKSSVEMSI